MHNGSSINITSIHSTKRLVLLSWFRISLWRSKIKLNHLPLHLSTKGSSFSLDDVNSSKSSWVADAAIKYKQATDLKSLSWIITHSTPATLINSHLQYLTIWPNSNLQDFIHLYKTIFKKKKRFVKLKWYCLEVELFSPWLLSINRLCGPFRQRRRRCFYWSALLNPPS